MPQTNAHQVQETNKPGDKERSRPTLESINKTRSMQIQRESKLEERDPRKRIVNIGKRLQLEFQSITIDSSTSGACLTEPINKQSSPLVFPLNIYVFLICVQEK